jgi:short subunit dehydrogenase-like uncharacterized protein
LPLVVACTKAGTHYADLAGEVAFIRDSIDTCHDAAAQTGVRIVHACGFDSIPSDLGVLLLHQAAERDGAGDLEETTLVVRSGSVPGAGRGTAPGASGRPHARDSDGDTARRAAAGRGHDAECAAGWLLTAQSARAARECCN